MQLGPIGRGEAIYIYGLPASTLQPITAVLHFAARLIKSLSPRDHVTQTLRELHWLPIPAYILKSASRPPDIPSLYKLISLLCFLTCYTLFISPIQTSSAIFISS